MTTRRKRIQDLIGNNFNPINSNASLWLDKFIEDATNDKAKRISKDEDKPRVKFVNQVVKIKEPSIYKTYFEKVWQTNLQNFGAKCREAKVKNRLAINLGSENVLETSISLHRVFGVPFVPGSALKGLVSHFLHQYGGNEWGKESEKHTVVFGNQDNAGFVTFYDALYVPESGFKGRPLYADVMTTHHQEYYGNNNVPPADWDNPNPVPFISATGKYLIALSGPNDWVDLTFDILGYALQIEGVGAKTSSGYGRFCADWMPEIEFRKTSQTDETVSDLPTAPPANQIVSSIITRINALKNNDVAGQINNFVNEWRNIEDEIFKKGAAKAIKQKVIDAGREGTSAEKDWFKQISIFAE